MRKRYLVKRFARNMRVELSTYSRADLKSLAEMHILFTDDTPQEQRLQYEMRKSLAKQMLVGDSVDLGVSYRSGKRRKVPHQF
jgi:hypothetical protein